jgi:hypothetical protein
LPTIIEACEDTEFMPKLEVGVLYSRDNFVDFFPNNGDMSAFLMFAVISLIVTHRGGSLIVWST